MKLLNRVSFVFCLISGTLPGVPYFKGQCDSSVSPLGKDIYPGGMYTRADTHGKIYCRTGTFRYSRVYILTFHIGPTLLDFLTNCTLIYITNVDLHIYCT